MSTIDPAILALAGVGCSDPARLPRDGWAARWDDVVTHRLAGFLAAAADEGLVDLDPGTADRLRARLDSEAIRAVQLEGELIRLESVLAELDAVVLKGAVLAHAAYPDPALRPFTDLDLLVTGDRHEEAVAALGTLGYTRSRPEPIRGYDATIGKALTLVHPGGVVIDLHRTLVPGLAGATVSVPEILADRTTVTVNGRPVPAPSWDAHLVEVCAHAVIGDGLSRALSIRDVVQVARHPEVDAEHAVELARRWKLTSTVAAAVRAATEHVGAELPIPLVELAGRSEPRESVDAAVAPEDRSSQRRMEELRGGGIRRRIAVARSLVLPSREFLRFTYGEGSTPSLYWRRWRTLSERSRGARPPSPDPVAGPAGEPEAGAPVPPVLPPLSARPEPPEPRPDAAAAAPRPLRRAPGGPTPRLPAVVGPIGTIDGTGQVGPRAVDLPPRVPRATVALARASLSAAAVEHAQLRPRATTRDTTGPVSRQQRWAAARPPRPVAGDADRGGARTPPPRPPGGEPRPGPGAPEPATGPTTAPAAAYETGTRYFVGGVVALLLTAAIARTGIAFSGVVLVPVAGLLFAMAMARRLARTRPDEAWVGDWLIAGVVVKILASLFRYYTLVSSYNGNGDAAGFDQYGREFAKAWMGQGVEPYLQDLRKTNFLRWFTGVVYYVFGDHMVAGFFIFGLLALVGSYLWYRATVESVPFIDKRLYLFLVLFAPSIAFWPSSIGKESLMQLGIGAMALATAFFLKQRLIKGLLLGFAGGWVLWVVRPHLLALVTIASGFAYIVGMFRPRDPNKGVATRTIGLVVIAVLVAFTVGQGMKFLGMKDLSLNSVEQTLNTQAQQTGEGGSSFDTGGDYLSPVNLPRGFATVLLRPFPWEAGSPLGLVASLETVILAGALVVRFSSIRTSLSRGRETPFLLYCWVLTILYAMTFASFANFGILVRQRSLVLPALFVLLAVRPVRRQDEAVDVAAAVTGRPVPEATR